MSAFAVMFYYPIVRGIYITFFDYQLGGTNEWIGLGNYIWLATNDLFWQAFQWTMVFVASTTFLQLVVGLVLAVLVNELTSGWREWTTAIIMSPYFCASLIGGIVWQWFVDAQYGVMGRLFRTIGLEPIYFLAEGAWPYVVLIIAQTWHDFAYAGLIYVAALKSIPNSQYEAAAIDGARARVLHPRRVRVRPARFPRPTGAVLHRGLPDHVPLDRDSHPGVRVFYTFDLISTYTGMVLAIGTFVMPSVSGSCRGSSDRGFRTTSRRLPRSMD